MAIAAISQSQIHADEIDIFYSSPLSKILKIFLIALAGIVISLLIFAATSSVEKAELEYENSRAELALDKSDWSVELIQLVDQNHIWLKRHGLLAEVILFEQFGEIIFSSASSFHINREDSRGLAKLAIDLHFIFSRLAFAILASWRLWLFLGILGFLHARTKVDVYNGDDLLGKTGNGRIYDSSIHINFDEQDVDNSLHSQLRGLASPIFASKDVLHRSRLLKLLEHFDAVNDTNRDLIRIILFYNSVPGYLPEVNKTKEQIYSKILLPEYAELWLQAALAEHYQYKQNNLSEQGIKKISEFQLAANQNGNLFNLIKDSLAKVQTEKSKSEISKLEPAIIATMVLSNIASRSLTYKQEPQGWVVKTKSPDLAARALLHSLASFAVDYDSEHRKWLRQSLILSKRIDGFLPIGMPFSLSVQTVALRNWSELIFGSVVSLNANADNLELYALATEIHSKWLKNFCEVLSTSEKLFESILLTPNNFIILPFELLTDILQNLAKTPEFLLFEERINKLGLLNDNQLNKIDTKKDSIVYPNNLLLPFDFLQIKELARFHALPESILKLWSSYRIILRTFGWLPARACNFSISDSYINSLRFTSYVPDQSTSHIEKQAMVVMNRARLSAQLGSEVLAKFRKIEVVAIASNAEKMKEILNSSALNSNQKSNSGEVLI